VCRSLPPALRVSVSPLEKADAQTSRPRVSDVPDADSQLAEPGDNLRPGTDAQRRHISIMSG
jgi:hypothetical protein